MTRPYEILTEVLTESSDGRPIKVSSVLDTAPTNVHIMTSTTALDSVWLDAHNTSGSTVNVKVIINPATAGSSDVADAALEFVIPRYSSIRVLEGLRVRRALATYTIAAYVTTGGAGGDILLTGHVVRSFRSAETL